MLRKLQVYLIVAVVVTLITPASIIVGAPQAAALRVESGTKLPLELDTPLNTATAGTGDIVLLHVRRAISVDGRVAIPPGTRVKGDLVSVKSVAVNRAQRPEIQIRLQEILSADGVSLRLSADVLKVNGRQSTSSSAGSIAQGLPGPLLSGVSGGGRSAAIGAAVTVITAATQPRPTSSDLDLPAGTPFEVMLERDLDIPDPERLASVLTPTAPASASAPLFLDSKMGAPISEAPAVPVRLKVDVDLVQVDAIVRNRNGRLIPGLQKEDFRIFQDGVEQKIEKVSIQEQSLAVAMITDGLAQGTPSVDSQYMAAKLLKLAGPAYQLARQLRPNDAISWFSIIDHAHAILKMHQELTTDRQRIENFNFPPVNHALIGIRAMDFLKQALRYLEVAATGRRRIVVLALTTGFVDMGSNASIEEVLKLALKTNTAIYAVEANYSSDSGIALGEDECKFHHIQCDKNGVPVNGLPPYPQFTRIPPVLAHQAVYDPFPEIVRKTGGQRFTFRPGEFSDNDSVMIGSALAKTISRLKQGYTISYAPATHPIGSYHKIEVRLADHFGRPGLDYMIYSQAGYYGSTSNDAVRQ
jgi:VWFA-related protein